MLVGPMMRILISSTNWEVTSSFLLTFELGIEKIFEKLQVDIKVGLTGSDFNSRKEQFGSNYRPEAVARTWWSLFLQALEDFMLRALIVCAIISLVFNMILASPEHRKEGKNHLPPFLACQLIFLCDVNFKLQLGSRVLLLPSQFLQYRLSALLLTGKRNLSLLESEKRQTKRMS